MEEEQRQWLTDKEVAARYAVTRQTLWRWVKRGFFPRPVALTPGCPRWKVEDIEIWEKAKRESTYEPETNVRAK